MAFPPVDWEDHDGDRVRVERVRDGKAIALLVVAGRVGDAACWMTAVQARALRDWLGDLLREDES